MHPPGDSSPPRPARPDARNPESEVVEEMVEAVVEEVVEVDAVLEASSLNQEVPKSPEDDGKRPTPVRMAMEGGEEADEEDETLPRVIEDPDSSMRWIVTVGGRSASGILPLRTVPVMELTFAREDAPNEALRTVLCYGKSLPEVPNHDLLACLRRSRPFREPMRPQEERDRKGRTKGGRPPKR